MPLLNRSPPATKFPPVTALFAELIAWQSFVEASLGDSTVLAGTGGLVAGDTGSGELAGSPAGVASSRVVAGEAAVDPVVAGGNSDGADADGEGGLVAPGARVGSVGVLPAPDPHAPRASATRLSRTGLVLIAHLVAVMVPDNRIGIRVADLSLRDPTAATPSAW